MTESEQRAAARGFSNNLSRRQFLIGAGAGALALSSSGLLAACGGSSAPPSKASAGSGSGSATPPGTGTLRVGIGSAPQTLDADKVIAGTDYYFTANVFETLIGYDANAKPVNLVAESWTASPDGTVFTFKLRPGVKFHDGTPVTAADIQYSLERYIDPKVGNGFAFNLASLSSVQIISPDTVAVHLKQYDAGFIPGGTFAAIVPMHYVQAHGETYFGQHPIATGPWMFDSYTQNENFTLKRFEQYWGEKPGYATAIFPILPDDSTRMAALQSGTIDVAAQVPPQDIKQISSTSGLVVKQVIDGDDVCMKFNLLPSQKGKPWTDVRVRMAMSCAIDRQSILQAVLLGGAEISSAIQPSDEAWPAAQAAGVVPPAYDPDKAKQLLAAAGYAKGFSFQVAGLVNGRFPSSEQVVEAIAGDWQAIGLSPDVLSLSYNTWDDSVEKGSPYPLMFMSWGDSTDGPSGRLQGMYQTGGPFSNLADPTLDAMIKQYLGTVDEQLQTQRYVAIGKYIMDNVYIAPLYSLKGAFAMKSSVNWQPWVGTSATIMKNATPA